MHMESSHLVGKSLNKVVDFACEICGLDETACTNYTLTVVRMVHRYMDLSRADHGMHTRF